MSATEKPAEAMSARAPALFRLPANATDRQKGQWKKQMLLWLSDQIEQQVEQQTAIAPAVLSAMTPEYLREWSKEIRIQRARSGHPDDLQRLQKLYPELADFNISPRREKGRPPDQREFNVAKVAADFTRRIRALWQKQYGSKNRKQGEISAEDFALDICKGWYEEEAAHLIVDEVKAAAKPSGRHKRRRKNTRQIA
jgi:hypothetical protein